MHCFVLQDLIWWSSRVMISWREHYKKLNYCSKWPFLRPIFGWDVWSSKLCTIIIIDKTSRIYKQLHYQYSSYEKDSNLYFRNRIYGNKYLSQKGFKRAVGQCRPTNSFIMGEFVIFKRIPCMQSVLKI